MLGDGTAESHARAQRALDDLWLYTDELFVVDDVDRTMIERGIGTDPRALRESWLDTVKSIVAEATLTLPVVQYPATGGRIGRHTEHLGRMLADMQSLARAHPEATW
jgi:ring-1,2-phenylacetyl-CoA epoxidase subunit PaaC